MPGTATAQAVGRENPVTCTNAWKEKSCLRVGWWALKDLNLRPTDYESAALTAELRARAF